MQQKTGMTANTQGECPGLCSTLLDSLNYIHLEAQSWTAARPGTRQTRRRSQSPFGADVNRLCRSHQQHHGAHLGALLRSFQRLLCSGWERLREVKERNSIQPIFKLKPASKSNAAFVKLLLHVGQYPNEGDEHTKRQWGVKTRKHTETVTDIHSWMNRRMWTNSCSCHVHVMNKNSSQCQFHGVHRRKGTEHGRGAKDEKEKRKNKQEA